MRTITGLLLIGLIGFSSCQKDLDVFVPDLIGGPDSTWFNTISNDMPVVELRNSIRIEKHIDSFELNTNPVTITLSTGLTFNFLPGSIITANNTVVTGKIFIETQLLKKKADMIRMNTPTISNNRLLVSGGEIFIRIFKNGSELQLAQGRLYQVKFNDDQPSPLMKLFNGDESNSMAFNWLQNQDTTNKVYALSQSYEIISNRLHWINCDYFYDTTGIAQTTVVTNLPYNYTNANTMAFTVFNNLKSVVGMYGNATTKKFSTGKLPVNQQVTIVVIAKQGNDYFLGHEQATTSGAAGTTNNQQVTVTPVITTLDNLKAYLNSL